MYYNYHKNQIIAQVIQYEKITLSIISCISNMCWRWEDKARVFVQMQYQRLHISY